MHSRFGEYRIVSLDPAELPALLDDQRPTTVLSRLSGDVPLPLAVYKAEALMNLEREPEVRE